MHGIVHIKVLTLLMSLHNSIRHCSLWYHSRGNSLNVKIVELQCIQMLRLDALHKFILLLFYHALHMHFTRMNGYSRWRYIRAFWL